MVIVRNNNGRRYFIRLFFVKLPLWNEINGKSRPFCTMHWFVLWQTSVTFMKSLLHTKCISFLFSFRSLEHSLKQLRGLSWSRCCFFPSVVMYEEKLISCAMFLLFWNYRSVYRHRNQNQTLYQANGPMPCVILSFYSKIYIEADVLYQMFIFNFSLSEKKKKKEVKKNNSLKFKALFLTNNTLFYIV